MDGSIASNATGTGEAGASASQRERERERDAISTITCQLRNEIVPYRSKCGFGPSCSSISTTLGTASSASNHLISQCLDALKSNITGT